MMKTASSPRSGDTKNFADIASMERAIRENDEWHETLALLSRSDRRQ